MAVRFLSINVAFHSIFLALRLFDMLSSFEISSPSSISEVLRVRDGSIFVENFCHIEIDSIITAMFF